MKAKIAHFRLPSASQKFSEGRMSMSGDGGGDGCVDRRVVPGVVHNQLLVFSVTPFKIDQNKKSKPFNRLSLEYGNRKKIDMQRLSPRFRSQKFFLREICGEMFSTNL